MPVRFLAVGFFAIYAGVDAGSHIRREIPPHTFDSAQAKASKLATEYLTSSNFTSHNNHHHADPDHNDWHRMRLVKMVREQNQLLDAYYRQVDPERLNYDHYTTYAPT